MKKIILSFLILFSTTFVLSADVNSAYIYSQYNNAISSAEAMTVKTILDSKSIINEKGTYETFDLIEDVCIDSVSERIYILDQRREMGYVIRGNKAVPVESTEVLDNETFYSVSTGKIVAVDNEYRYVSRYPDLKELDLEQYELFRATFSKKYLDNPTALFISDNYIFVSDTNNGRIFTIDKELTDVVSEDLQLFQNPDDIAFDTTAFRPTKFVFAENTGRIYTVASGVFEGIVDFEGAKHATIESGYAQGKIAYKRYATSDINSIESPEDNSVYFDIANKTASIYQDNSWVSYANYSNLTNEAWIVGEGSPADSIGINDDIYINSLTGSIYYKDSGTWTYYGKFNQNTMLTESIRLQTGVYFGTSDNMDESELEPGAFYIDSANSTIYYRLQDSFKSVAEINSSLEDTVDEYGNIWDVGSGSPTFNQNETRTYYIDLNTFDFYYNTSTRWTYAFNFKTSNFINNETLFQIGNNIYQVNASNQAYGNVSMEENIFSVTKNGFKYIELDLSNYRATYGTIIDELNHTWYMGINTSSVTSPAMNDIYLNISSKNLYEYGANGWQLILNYVTDTEIETLSYLPSNKIFIGTRINNDIGDNGDLFIDHVNGVIYQKKNNQYEQYVIIKNADNDYISNLDIDNHRWYVGPEIPTTDLGVEGDYWINYLTGDIYKRAVDIWEHYVNFSEMIAKKGVFNRFYGTNSVASSSIWDLFKSAFQRRSTGIKLQLTFTNLTIDDGGYIYTVSPSGSGLMIKKLNFLGRDVLKPTGVRPTGELVTQWYDSSAFAMGASTLMDIALMNDCIYSVVDSKYDRIYTYDFEGNLLYISGQNGNTYGNIKQPTAIGYLNDDLILTDREKNQIMVFEPTDFGRAVNLATEQYYEGDYITAANSWLEVLDFNTNYFLAYAGIGKSQYRDGLYEEAMNNFKLGYDRTNYSRAYKEYRQDKLEIYMPYVLGAFALLVVYGFYKSFKVQFLKNKDEEDIV